MRSEITTAPCFALHFSHDVTLFTSSSNPQLNQNQINPSLKKQKYELIQDNRYLRYEKTSRKKGGSPRIPRSD